MAEESQSKANSMQTELGIARRELAEVKDQCSKLQRENEALRELMRAKELRMQAALEEKDREIQDVWDKSDGPMDIPAEVGGQAAFLMQRVMELRRKYARAASKSTFFEQKLVSLLEEIEAKSTEIAKQQEAFAKVSQAYLSTNAQLEKLQAIEATQAAAITELQVSLHSEQAAVQATTQDCQDLAWQVRTLMAENERLKGNGGRESGETGMEEMEDLQRENWGLKRRLREQEMLARAEATIAAQKEIQAKEQEIEQLKQEITALHTYQQSLSPSPPFKPPATCMSCTGNDSLMSSLQLQLAAAEQREFVLQTELCAVHEAWKQHSANLTHTETALSAAREEITRLKAQNDAFSQHIAIALKDNARMRGQCEGLMGVNSNLTTRLTALEAEHMRLMTSEAQDKDTLYSQLKHLQASANRDKVRLTTAVISLKSEHENLLFELQNQTRFTASRGTSEQEMQIKTLKSTLRTLESTHTQQTADIRARLVEAARVEATQGQTSFIRLREQLSAALTQSQIKEMQYEAIVRELEEVKKQKVDLEGCYAQLQTDSCLRAVDKQQISEETDRNLRELQEKYANLLNELNASVQNSKILQDKLNMMQRAKTVDTSSLLKLTTVMFRYQKQLIANPSQ